MYRSIYNNEMGNTFDRYSDNNRRSMSASPSPFDRGNCVLKIYQWLHFCGLLTVKAII